MIRYVDGEVFVGSNTIGNPSTISYMNPVNPGNLMIAVQKSNQSGAVTIPNFTDPYGAQQIGNSVHYVTVLKGTAASGQSQTITATNAGAGTVFQFNIAQFSGVTSTEDAPMVVTNGGTTSINTLSTGTITTTTPNCLLIAFFATATATSQPLTSIDSGFTIIAKGNQNYLAYKIVNTAGAHSATWSWNTAGRVTTGILAFQTANHPNTNGFFGM